VLLALPGLYWLRDARASRKSTAKARALAVWSVALPILAATAAVVSARAGRLVPLMEGGTFRFRLGNNPNAVGLAFPYPPIVEPSGWGFLLHMPGRFLWLLGRRFLYLWGILTDTWSLPPAEMGRGSWEPFLAVAALGLFVFGLVAAVRERRKGAERLYLPIVAVAFPPLIYFGSKRFLIPAMPEIALFQAYALVRLAEYIRVGGDPGKGGAG
jgi:hypothetical protein